MATIGVLIHFREENQSRPSNSVNNSYASRLEYSTIPRKKIVSCAVCEASWLLLFRSSFETKNEKRRPTTEKTFISLLVPLEFSFTPSEIHVLLNSSFVLDPFLSSRTVSPAIARHPFPAPAVYLKSLHLHRHSLCLPAHVMVVISQAWHESIGGLSVALTNCKCSDKCTLFSFGKGVTSDKTHSSGIASALSSLTCLLSSSEVAPIHAWF